MHQLAQSLNIGDYAIDGPEQNGGVINLSGDALGTIVGRSLQYVFLAAGIGLLLMIISSGFTLMTAAGDAKKMAAGRGRLTNAIVGFLLIFASFWIVQLVGVILGWESILTVFGQ